jgi:hypothetical protein
MYMLKRPARPNSYGSIPFSLNYYHRPQLIVIPLSGKTTPISQPLVPCKLHMLSSSLGNPSIPCQSIPFHAFTCSLRSKTPPSSSFPSHLNSPRNTQLANLAQHILHPRVEITTSILVARRSIEVLLHLRHAAVSFRAETQLDFDERFECGVEVGDSDYHRSRQ